jgi:uncharacterized damage-inducible protein DinB
MGKYKEWMDKIGEEAIKSGEIHYKDIKGNSHPMLIHEVFTHVNNHHSHHLGQLSAAYRELTGKDDFVSIDYTYYNL